MERRNKHNISLVSIQNANDLEQEIIWFTQVLDVRFKLYFAQECEFESIDAIQPPDLSYSASPYAQCIQQNDLGAFERIALILALVPHIRPQLLDLFFTQNKLFSRPFTEFGGLIQAPYTHFMPTVETLCFILAGNDLALRFYVLRLLESEQVLLSKAILKLIAVQPSAGKVRYQLDIHPDYLSYFTLGERVYPSLSADFPAQYIETQLSWEDLVLHPGTRRDIDDIALWLQHSDTLMQNWQLASKLRPGYRALFYGPPGTGKTMTACLLAKHTERDVYKIDLSLIVSKYIGETEKNLARVFDQAQYKGWILFFDEADALFGKRTETQNSHDRYANQEVSFLLQRIESFDGIIILASNFRENLDDAFMRRFESLIYFPMPRADERFQLWQRGFSAQSVLEDKLDLSVIAKEYTLSGAAIINVVRYASLQSVARGENIIRHADVVRGIRKEYAKLGKR